MKLKLSGYVEGNVQLSKKHYVHTTASTALTITATTEANDNKVELSGNVEGDIELNQSTI